jgi:hypothetical protein
LPVEIPYIETPGIVYETSESIISPPLPEEDTINSLSLDPESLDSESVIDREESLVVDDNI